VYKNLPADKKTTAYSSVPIAKSNKQDKGYVWMDGGVDFICCHSTVVATGPMSSAGRKSYRLTDPELETQLRSAISAIYDASP
jgi:hypothetical protein